MPEGPRGEMPRTIARSPAKARRTWQEAHDSAVETYGEGERAHRTAYAALKHCFEKRGDRWAPKERCGPSDTRAAGGVRKPGGKTYGGVDYLGSSREELLDRAKALGIRGRSRMRKEELAEAIARKQ